MSFGHMKAHGNTLAFLQKTLAHSSHLGYFVN